MSKWSFKIIIVDLSFFFDENVTNEYDAVTHLWVERHKFDLRHKFLHCTTTWTSHRTMLIGIAISLSSARADARLDFDASIRALILTCHSAADRMTSDWELMDDDSRRRRLYASPRTRDRMGRGRSMALWMRLEKKNSLDFVNQFQLRFLTFVLLSDSTADCTATNFPE